jgi:hypothetical protein
VSISKNKKKDNNVCFLCKESSSKKITREHLFPGWLLRKYELLDKKIELLNNTVITYKDLVIPSCNVCNNQYLSFVETNISKAIASGYKKIIKVDSNVLFLWILKIFYGLLVRESSLYADRTDPKKKYIVNGEDLDSFKYLHFYLHGFIKPMIFEGGLSSPASVFIFKIKEPNDVFSQFTYKDMLFPPGVAIRMGSVGIIMTIDFQSQEGLYSEMYKKLQGPQLHPLQFDELIARIFYQASLFVGNLSVISSEEKNYTSVTLMPPSGDIFLPGNDQDFEKIKNEYTRGCVIKNGNCLFDENGNVFDMSLNAYPYECKEL